MKSTLFAITITLLGSMHSFPQFPSAAPYLIPPYVTGLPYSADQVNEQEWGSPDGTKGMRTTSSRKTYRDTAGRTRLDGADGTATIIDPILNLEYKLDTAKKTLTRRTISPRGPRNKVPVPKSLPGTSDLGERIIATLLCDGQRVETSVAKQDNGTPIVLVTEIWTSRDLYVPVLFRLTDPRFGELRTRLVNITRVEPDPSLFRIPSGFTIQDSTE